MASSHGQPVFCWRVSKGHGMAFILGEVRVRERELFPLPDVINEAFDRADLLIGCSPTETDPERKAKELRLLLYPEGMSLLDRLCPETRAELERYCEATGFSVEPSCRVKPVFIADVNPYCEA